MRGFQFNPEIWLCLVVFSVGTLAGSVIGCSQENTPAAAATASADSEASEDGLPAVNLIAPQRRSIETTTTQPARVHAYYQAEIYAKAAGYLEELRTDIGETVEAGEVLGVVAVPEMQKEMEHQEQIVERLQAEEHRAETNVSLAEAQVKRARARSEQAQAEIAKSEAEVVAQQAEHERIKNLVSRKSVQERLLDEARKKLDAAQAARGVAEATWASAQAESGVAEANLETARAGLEITRAETRVARKKLEELDVLTRYATLTAPFPGVVTQRHVDPGDLVRNTESADEAPRQPLFTIAQLDRVRVQVMVPERDAPRVDVGDPATIRFESLHPQPYEGKVSRTARSLDRGTQTLLVEIDLPNPNGRLMPGMYGEATIVLDSTNDALMLPANVVRFDEQGRSYVFVTDSDGRLQKVEVVLGIDTGTELEIVSGLDGSEQNVAATSDTLRPGQMVRIRER